jgi:hypothetical protein
MKKQNIKICVIDENLKVTLKNGIRKVSKTGLKRTAEFVDDVLQRSPKKANFTINNTKYTKKNKKY